MSESNEILEICVLHNLACMLFQLLTLQDINFLATKDHVNKFQREIAVSFSEG